MGVGPVLTPWASLGGQTNPRLKKMRDEPGHCEKDQLWKQIIESNENGKKLWRTKMEPKLILWCRVAQDLRDGLGDAICSVIDIYLSTCNIEDCLPDDRLKGRH